MRARRRTRLWTQLWAQLRRDLAEWWPLPASALLLGLSPLVVPRLVAAGPDEASDLRLVAAAVVAGLFALVAVAVLGDSLAARDVAEGRLGFYLARPISAAAFWLARLTAALVLLVAILVSLTSPTWLSEHSGGKLFEPSLAPSTMALTAPELSLEAEFEGLESQGVLPWLLPVGGAGLLLSLLLAAHMVSTVARSRSPWALADVVGLTAVAALLVAAQDLLRSAHAHGALVVAERLFLAALAVILAVAGYRQLSRGRADLVRGHGVLSRSTWPPLMMLALALLAASQWVTSPRADDLRAAERVWASPDGRYVSVLGPARHRLGMKTEVVYSPRGPEGVIGGVSAIAGAAQANHLAWIRCRRYSPLDCDVWTWRPNTEDPRSAGISATSWPSELALSPQGELLALGGHRLEIWQPDLPRLVFALDRPATLPAFLSATRLRYLTTDAEQDTTTLEELDLVDRSVRPLARLPGDILVLRMVTSPSGRFVLVSSMTPPTLTLVDCETGSIHELHQGNDWLGPGGWAASARFVGSELFLLLGAEGRAWRLVRLDLASQTGDTPASDVGMPPGMAPGITRFIPSLGSFQGHLLLASTAPSGGGAPPRFRVPSGVEPLEDARVWAFDAESGSWSPFVNDAGLFRQSTNHQWQQESTLFVAGGGSILHLDSETRRETGGDGLRLMVPALPETLPNRWF